MSSKINIKNPNSGKIIDLMQTQTWYLLKNESLIEVDICKSTQLQQLQTFIGGYIESVKVSGKSEAYIDEEGHPSCKNLPYNNLANVVFGVSVYGPLIVKATKPIVKIIEAYKNIKDSDEDSSDSDHEDYSNDAAILAGTFSF